jgi:predicted DNA-binding antitoxin AbrB/MazE fold protein
MEEIIEVVHEKGVFKPLEPVEIPEGTKMPITLTKSDKSLNSRQMIFIDTSVFLNRSNM